MISALFYLQFHSVRNRLGARLRRLKHPKYLVGAVIGVLYFGFYFYLLSGASRPTPSNLPGADPFLSENLGALLLLLAVVAGWVIPNERASLAFSEAEINFLFPAPVTRRELIHYKLVRRQIAILFSVFFLTLIWGRWRSGGPVWISALGWWTILSALDLHVLAGSFARTMLLDRGITNLRRRVIICVLLAVIIGGVCAWSWQTWPPLPAGGNFEELEGWLKEVLSTGAAPYVLYPFRLIVRPYFATDALSFLKAFAPALMIIAAHYVLVMRADVAFEEASIEYSQKLAARVSAALERRVPGGMAPKKARRAPFALAPVGMPSVAFLWKNLILAGNFFSGRSFMRIAIFIVVWAVLIFPGTHHSPGGNILGFLCVMLLFMSLFIGQNLLRIDFRSDLSMAEQLMLYPMHGWQVVLGEILAPLVILAAAQWLLILGAALFLTPHEISPDATIAAADRLSVALAAAIVAPAIDFIMLIIPNGVALLLPSWVRFDKNAPRGIENFGQNFLVVIGQLAVMAVALLPAGLVFALAAFLAELALPHPVALPMAALTCAAVLAAEGGIAIRILGKAFERFDLSAETTN
jgi:hypothetical protein